MAGEGKPGRPANSREAHVYQGKLKSILTREVTLENVDTYAEQAVDELIELIEDVSARYKKEHPEFAEAGNLLEDTAFTFYNLQDIEHVLTLAQEKSQQNKDIQEYIEQSIERVGEVLTPPDAQQGPRTPGEKRMRQPRFQSRLHAVLYMLTSQGIDLNDIRCTEGVLLPTMMRQTSYVSVEIPGLNRLAHICDEVDNASYLFDLQRLKELNVSVEDINRLTKDEKNTLIDTHLGLGQRFIGKKTWMARFEHSLLNELEERKESQSDPRFFDPTFPRVSTTELDSWKGFWTDPVTDKHYGPYPALINKTGTGRIMLDLNVDWSFVEKKDIVSGNRVVTCFAYEDVLAQPAIKKILDIPVVEKGGEWNGFWTNPQTGEHFGLVLSLMKKFNLSRSALDRIIENIELKETPLRGMSGKVTRGFSYEALASDPHIQEMVTLPHVAEKGEWTGFYEDEEGKHWGTISALKTRLQVHTKVISEEIANRKLEMKRIYATGTEDGYPYEDLIESSRIQDLMTSAVAESTGEWKTFWTDPADGSHWGTKKAIARKLHRDYYQVDAIVKENNLQEKSIRVTGRGKGGRHTAYKFEDVDTLLKK